MTHGWLLMLVCMAVISCSTTPTSRFYLLDAIHGPAGAPIAREADTDQVDIGLGAVELPGYLDRNRMVRRTGRNTLVVNQFDLWSEPLDVGVQRVIAANLSGLLPGARVHRFPWPRGLDQDYRVMLTITRFDTANDGSVLLEGTWSLQASGNNKASGNDKTTGKNRAMTQGAYSFPVPSLGTANADIAAAMSEALAALSRDMAHTLGRVLSMNATQDIRTSKHYDFTGGSVMGIQWPILFRNSR